MNSPPSLCLSTCPRWCHINPPSRVTNQPPADAAPVRHRGSLTCALALQTRLAGLLCGEAKNAPWTATGKRPVRSWDGFELPKADALGAVIGRFLVGLLTDRTISSVLLGEVGHGLSADHSSLGSSWSISFSLFRGAHGNVHHAPNRASYSAYKPYSRQGSWLPVTMHRPTGTTATPKFLSPPELIFSAMQRGCSSHAVQS